MNGRLAVVAVAVAIAAHSSAETLGAQARHDTIRGRVTTDSGAVIAGADVIVTMAPTAQVFRQLSDSSGNFALTIADGSGEYLLYVGAVGRRPFRQRLTRANTDTTFIINVRLAAAVTTVATATVRAQRARPQRGFNLAGDFAGTSGLDKTVDGVSGALPPDMVASLDAMASTVPGLSVSGGGISAFGLGSDNNKSTLNGLAFGGGDLPRDARTSTRFITSPWDPTVGGFAGVLAAQTLQRGGNISSRNGHVTADDPALQYSDAAASHLGQEFSNLTLGQGGTGPLRLDELFFNYAFQLNRRSAPVASLVNLDPAALSIAGVSRDSAARLVQILTGLNVPVRRAGIPQDRTTTSASFIEQIDHALPPGPQGSIPTPTWRMTAFGAYSQSDAFSLSPVATPTSSGKSTTLSGALQGFYSRYFGAQGDYANELTSSLSYSEGRGSAYLNLPGGNVLINSALPDGTTGLGALTFGGSSPLSNDSRNWTWEVVNQTNFLAGGHASLPMKVYFQSRLDGFAQTIQANRLGSFSFPSLAALAANAPSGFSRTLHVPDPTGGQWTGAAAVGGSWTKGALSLTGGARVDANLFTATPTENSTLASRFGANNDHAPNSVEVTPRLGFTYKIPGTAGNSMFASQIGAFSQGPTVLRGGVGLFRSVLPSTLLSGAMTSTGLPGSTQRLSCIGPAAPVPDWTAYGNDPATVPTACLGSSGFADTAPSVTLFGPSYRPAEGWRGTLGVTKTLWSTYLAADIVYARNLYQAGTIDLNFAGAPRFSLASEGGRPVFVDPSSIVPATGIASTVQSRASGAFGRVSERVSDLSGDAKQFTLYAIPHLPFRFGMVTLGYTWADARADARGFDQTTAGDPRARESAPQSFTPRHTFLIQAARTFGSAWGITTFVRATSGLPFTPTVAGDINGDGSSNDRAFVFNPAVAADTAVGHGMTNLMSRGPSWVRDCLASQLGSIARRNSCVGPWAATMNASVYIFPALPATAGRAKVSLSLANVLGGVDQLLHGQGDLRGWGAVPIPDQTLLRVRAFDPSAQRFMYDVNPRFGSTSPATSSVRVPFRVTLDVAIDFGRPGAEQLLEQNLRVRPALVGTRAPADSIKRRYMNCNCSNGFSDFYGYLLTRLADSLALSVDQISRMQKERDLLRLRVDSIYTTLAVWLAAQPDDFDHKDALKRVTAASDSTWVTIVAEKDFIKGLLTGTQLRLLPQVLYQMVTVANFKGRFFFGF